MTQTTYYEFNKPEGTDLVNPLVDTNPNWDALDADLHEFNERSISNCNEVVSLGVHAISRLDTTAKFLKWIATANFTAGDTFTVDGLVVAASTPAGAALATNAYVAGSVVLACLNADNSAMTIFVSGTTVATDSERLGGELPSYYGTASDVADNASDITNLQNQVGNTSIVGIGDGTCTGAIDALNTAKTWKVGNSTTSVNTNINLPDDFDELLVIVHESSGTGRGYSYYLPKLVMASMDQDIRGFYASNTSYGNVTIQWTSTAIKFFGTSNGSAIASGYKMELFYR